VSYEIVFENDISAPDLPEQRLTEAVTWVLERHAIPDASGMTIVITDDDTVRSMNQQYRGVDAATDVLSFPADPMPAEIAEEEPPYLGDLIVAYPYTQRHAQEAGHPLDDELVLLAIHGTLHLLGYDHDNEENQQLMWQAQQAALDAFRVRISVPLFSFGDDS
jgi:probable rRNA maturation factor